MTGTRPRMKSVWTGIGTAMVLATVVFSLLIADSYAQKPTKKIGVFVNRRDKQKIVGYTRIALVWGQLFRPPQNQPRSIINLKEGMNRFTKIETDMDDHLELASSDLLKMPIVFIMSNDQVELTPTERENLKKYIELGGMIVVDAPQSRAGGPGAKAGASLKKMLKDVIPNARFEPLSNSHGIYHSFFDFNDGPPLGSENKNVTPNTWSKEIYYLEGVFYNGRLVAVYSEKGYGALWNASSDPQIRMAVNLIVFALTQEGGIASTY